MVDVSRVFDVGFAMMLMIAALNIHVEILIGMLTLAVVSRSYGQEANHQNADNSLKIGESDNQQVRESTGERMQEGIDANINTGTYASLHFKRSTIEKQVDRN